MRVMLDTNVLISAFVLKSKVVNQVVEKILLEHRLVLSTFVINELQRVVAKRFSGKTKELDDFLAVLPYECVHTPEVIVDDLFEIRDHMDYPVLYSAIIGDVDVFITGDKDFAEVVVEKPEILAPRDFYDKYIQE